MLDDMLSYAQALVDLPAGSKILAGGLAGTTWLAELYSFDRWGKRDRRP